MAKLISQSCGELQPAVCLSREIEPSEGHPCTRGCLTSLRNKPQQKHPGKLSASCLHELLVNVYSICLMVNCMSYCYVHESRLFSNLVTMYIPVMKRLACVIVNTENYSFEVFNSYDIIAIYSNIAFLYVYILLYEV